MIHLKSIRGRQTGWIQKGKHSPSGTVFMFLHGFPDDPHIWQEQIDHFSKQGLVIAPFLRGCGKSPGGSDSGAFETKAICLDLLEILRDATSGNAYQVVLVTHDIGGPIGWELARLLQKDLQCLITLNAPSLDQMVSRIRNSKQVLKSWYIFGFQIPKISDFVLKTFEPRLREFLEKKMGRPEKHQTRSDVVQMINIYRTLFKDAIKILSSGRSPKTISAPVLSLWGKDDPFLEVATSKELDRLADKHTIRVIDAGHWIQVESKDQANRLIEKFVNETRTEGESIGQAAS